MNTPTVNQMRRLLNTKFQVNTTGMDEQQIEDAYNREMIASTVPAQKAIETQAQAPQPQPQVDANDETIGDVLAATLLQKGVKGFKQDLEQYISQQKPEPSPPQIITRTVHLDHEGNEVIPDVDCTKTDSKPANELWPNLPKSADYLFPCADYSGETATYYDMTHLHQIGALQVIAHAQHHKNAIWLKGEKGTGKTTFCENLAATTGRPFFRIGHFAMMEVQDLIGSVKFDEKSVWEEGEFSKAISTPNAVILLDEPSLNTQCQQMYQTVLDLGYITIASTGKRIYIADGVNIFAADNTGGHGDETARYDGTESVNSAFLDRFTDIIELSYMSPAAEAQLLLPTGVNLAQAEAITDFANRIRSGVAQGDIEEPISFRRLKSLATKIAIGIDQESALEITVLNHVRNSTDRESYRALINTQLPQLSTLK
jgi:MoxR-like ATPase